MSLLLSNKNPRFFREMRDSFSAVDGSQQATLDKLKDLYSKSGSTKSFAEWINDLKKSQNVNTSTPILDWLTSDNAKNALAKAQGLVDTYNKHKHGDDNSSTINETKDTSNNSNTGEVTIFGLHPITFSFTAVGLLVGTYFLGRYLINTKHKNKNLKTT